MLEKTGWKERKETDRQEGESKLEKAALNIAAQFQAFPDKLSEGIAKGLSYQRM
jgi:hypothetical protein